MKRLLGLDQTYQQLKELGMLDDNFEQMPLNLIRKYVKTFLSIQGNKYVCQIIKILSQQNKSSQNSAKNLIFFNILIDEMICNNKVNLEDFLTNEINKIIEKEKIRYSNVHRGRANSRQSSVEKATNWLKQRFSKSKQKSQPQNRFKKSISMSQKNQPLQKSRSQITKPNLQNSCIDIELSDLGKQQVLITKLILPYASFLLKLVSSQIAPLQMRLKPSLRSQEIWKIINVFKSLLKISEFFPMILRYFSKQFSQLLFTIIRMMDYDMKLLIPTIQRSLTSRGDLIRKQILGIYQSNLKSKAKTQQLQHTADNLGISQFKQFMQQIALLNQQITTIYLGKYLYTKIMSEGLKQPTIFQQSLKYDLVFDVVKQVEKSKSISKRLSISKQKSFANIKDLKLSNLKSTHKKQNTQLTLFGQKRLKIMTQSGHNSVQNSPMTPVAPKSPKINKKQIHQLVRTSEKQKQKQIPTQKTVVAQATFRKIRKNATISQNIVLQNSDTSRLKL